MITLTIDGQSVEVPEGTTVLRAAEKLGVSIPTLCDHPALTPFGGCRLCVVEIEGARGPVTSCTMPVNPGMVVHTDTPKLREVRKFVLTLLFSERNHYCMYCQKSGSDCDLQNAAYHEDMTHWTLQPNWSRFKVDGSHPYIVLDHNRCILCRRCIRACGELVGNFTLDVHERGANTMVVADYDTPLGESSCVSCGMCVQACPTGALIDRDSAYQGLEKVVQRTATVCAGCSVGCGLQAVTRDNRLVRLDGDWDAPANHGLTCNLGRYVPMHEQRERLTRPWLRRNKGAAPVEVSWDEALDFLAARLKAGQAEAGLAALASARLPAEALHAFRQLFIEKLGSHQATSSAETGADNVPSQLEALHQADCVIVIGAGLLQEHQVVGFLIKRSLAKGVRLITLNAQPDKLAELAHHALQPKPNTEAALLAGLIAELKRQGLAKAEAALVSTGQHGVPAEAIQNAARLIGNAQRPVIVHNSSATPATLKAVAALLIGLGQAAVRISLKGQANSAAAAAYGLNQAFAVKDAQAVYLALGDEELAPALATKAAAAPFLAVQAAYASPLTAQADVVLPVEMWAEQDGHFVNLEGRLQTAHRALTPPEGVLSSVVVLQRLGQKLGLALNSDWQAAL